MRKLTLSLVLVGLLASVSLAGPISVPVATQGDGTVGSDRYGYGFPWEASPFDSSASPMWVGHWYDSPYGSSRDGYMQVALDLVPAAGEITQATLWINVLAMNGSGVISPVYHAADSSAANGNASQRIGCSQSVGAITDTSGTGWVGLDVTDYIKADKQNGYGYAAFYFEHTGYQGVTFSSAEDSANAPYLEVMPEPATLGMLGLGGLATILRRRRK